MEKPKGYWTYERCHEESKKYDTVADFRKYSSSAYVISKRNKWLFDFTHLQRKQKPTGYWTKERCYNAAKECKNYTEFLKKYGGACHAATDNNWIKDYTWFLTKKESLHEAWAEGKCRQRMYTFDECLTESKKYTTKKEFKENNMPLYMASKRHKWLDSFPWLKPDLNIYGKCDCVYKYFFKDYNAIYIGRTVRKNQRDKQHIFNVGNDAVADFAFTHNISVPPMEILEDNLTVSEGQEREKYYVDYFKELGYTILNKAKTGGIGRLNLGKWNYSTCRNEAQNYRRRGEFAKGNRTAYMMAWKYKWLDDFFPKCD